MALVDVGGASIAVSDVGSGEPTFVFLPSWACDASVWEPQVEALSATNRCIAIDFRGRGESSPIPPFTIKQAADDVAAVLRTLELEPVIVAGHSLGALVALLANHRYPELFSGIVVADPMLNAAAAGRLGALADAIREAGDMNAFEDYVDSFFVESTPAHVREAVRNNMLSCPVDVAAGQLSDADFLTDAIGTLVTDADKKPFMALWPQEPLGDPERLRDLTLFLRQEPVAGTGHFLMLERPEVVTALFRAFLDDVERDPRLQAG